MLKTLPRKDGLAVTPLQALGKLDALQASALHRFCSKGAQGQVSAVRELAGAFAACPVCPRAGFATLAALLPADFSRSLLG